MPSHQASSIDTAVAPEARSQAYRKKARRDGARVLVKRSLRRFPRLYTCVQQAWWAIKRTGYSLRWRWLASASVSVRGVRAAGIDIDKVFWVSPEQVTYCALQEFSLQRFKGHMLGGDWDTLQKRFDNLDIFRALRHVCVEGGRWEQTVFYERCLRRLEQGDRPWGCRSRTEFDARCRYIESLYHSIERQGYKSRQQLAAAHRYLDPFEDEVAVAISRHGDLMFSDGAHRLAIAKLQGIERIPVKVSVRHPAWVTLRKELLLYAGEQKRLYQPATHIDLADFPAFHACEDRLNLIRGAMTARRGRLLNIGANLGYFCHRFEEEGFDCYAVENSARELYFLQRLKRAGNKRFKVISESVLDCRLVRDTPFDVVLALNIFHHFLKTRETYEKLTRMLGELRTREMFFEPANPAEAQMSGTYRNYGPDEFVDWVLRASRLANAQLLGETGDGRRVYRLWR